MVFLDNCWPYEDFATFCISGDEFSSISDNGGSDREGPDSDVTREAGLID